MVVIDDEMDGRDASEHSCAAGAAVQRVSAVIGAPCATKSH